MPAHSVYYIQNKETQNSETGSERNEQTHSDNKMGDSGHITRYTFNFNGRTQTHSHHTVSSTKFIFAQCSAPKRVWGRQKNRQRAWSMTETQTEHDYDCSLIGTEKNIFNDQYIWKRRGIHRECIH